MSALRVLCVLGMIGSATAGETDAGANPIRKIVTLLQDMSKELEAEGKHEQELYDKFMCYCNGGTADLQKTIEDSAAQSDTLTAQLESERAESAGLNEDLAKHKAELASATQDLAKAEAVRSKEQAEFDEDFSTKKQASDALGRAIPALEKGMGGASLVQMDEGSVAGAIKLALKVSPHVSDADRKHVVAFLENGGDYDNAGSGQIVGILKSINDDMAKSMSELTADNSDSTKGFADLKDSKTQEVNIAKKAIEIKTARVGALAVSTVQSADGIEDANAENANAKKFLATLGVQCVEKKREFDERTKMRSDEVSAISEAINVLNDDDAIDTFKKTASFMQTQTSPSARRYGFLQRTPGVTQLRKAQRVVQSAVAFYKSEKLDVLLYTMGSQLRRSKRSAQAVDFGELVKMVDGMVAVLEKESVEDRRHRDFCQADIRQTQDETADKQEQVETLNGLIASMADEVSSTKQDMDDLVQAVATTDRDVAQATEQRKKEHSEYLETSQLTASAVQLMERAKNKLQKFYNPALHVAEEAPATEESFVQVGRVAAHIDQKQAPETWGSSYEKKGKKSGGVMALMDNLTNDLKASNAEAGHNEKTAQDEYVELMGESQSTRSQDSKTLTNKAAVKAQLEAKLVNTKESMHMTMKELEGLGKFMSELHGSCDFIVDNFDLRLKARTSEVESLKTVKAILAGANYN